MGIFKSKKEKEAEVKQSHKIYNIFMYVTPIFLAILLFCFIKFGIMNRGYKLESVDASKYSKLVESKKGSLIFFTTSECQLCDDTKALFTKVLKGSNIKVYQVELNKLSNDEIDKISSVLDITKDGIEAPLLIYVKEGSIISNFSVPVDEELFIQYLQDNKLVK